MSRVAVVAIDAGEWWFLQQLIEEGELPNLAQLQRKSAMFQLDAPMAYRSELSWARFLTGSEPFKTKDWAASITFDPGDYSLASTTASTRTPFYAFGPGTKVVTLDLIHSALADDVDGMQVVAWGAHSPQYPRSSRPAGLLAEIDRLFGPSPVFNNDCELAWNDPEYVKALADGSGIAVKRRAEIGRWLLERNPDWNLFMTCVSEVHTCGHLMWHGVDPASPLYGTAPAHFAADAFKQVVRATDEAIGTLLTAFPEQTNVVILAHHGLMPADDLLCTVLLPELLFRHHKGRSLFTSPDVTAWRTAGCPPIIPEADYPWGDYMVDCFADTTRQRLRRMLRQVLPRSAFKALRRMTGRPEVQAPATLSKSIPPECEDVDAEIDRYRGGVDYQPAAWYQRHWPTMRSFALPTFADGHVRINLQGRERDGLVAREDYHKAMDEVVDLLANCRDARTGAPILKEVLRVREDDPMDPDGPESDMLIIWEGAPDAIEHPQLGVIGPFPHMRTAHHSNHGFALVSGPDVEPGPRSRRSSTELTSTILSLLGRPKVELGASLLEVA